MCSLASRGVWWFLAMLVGFSASGQSLEESWELVDVGNCGGCGGLIAHDLDGDGVDEIITGGGWDWSYRRSNFVQVLRREGGAHKEWWTTGFYGVRMISRIVIHESPDSTSLFVILSTGQVQALDPMTGATRWSRDFAIESDVLDGAIVDLDGDGGLEIVLQSNFSVRAFDFESAAEKWQHPSRWPISFLVANLDLDSNLEVVFDNRDGNEAVLIVDGASGEVEWTYFGAFGAGLGAADLNGDGVNDIVGLAGNGFMTAFDAVGRTPLWQIDLQSSGQWHRVHFADTDGDGMEEMLVSVGDNYVRAFSTAATPTLLWKQAVNEYDPISTFTTGDVDGDGRPELISAVQTERARIAVTDLSDFSMDWISTRRTGPFTTYVADVDGDGRPEIVARNARPGRVYARSLDVLDVSGIVVGTVDLDITGLSNEIIARAVHDLDGDGRAELIATSADRLVVFDVTTGRMLRNVSLGDYWISIYDVSAGDLDGDGAPEIVVAVMDYVVILDAATLETKWQTIRTGNHIRRVWVTNVDDDAGAELIFSNDVLQAYDGATKALEWQIPTSSYATALAVVEYKGTRELVVGTESGLVVVVDPVTAVERTSRQITSSPIAHVSVQNLDGSAEPEIVVASESVYVLRSDDLSTAWKSKTLAASVDASQTSLDVADLDADGRMDVIYSNSWGIFSFEGSQKYLDVTPPQVIARTPPDGFAQASTGVRPTAVFSEAIAETTLGAGAISLTAGGESIAFDHQYDAALRRLTIYPQPELPSTVEISIKLASTITDTSGIGLDGNRNGFAEGSPMDDVVWSFRTGLSTDVRGPSVYADDLPSATLWKGLPLDLIVTATDTSVFGASMIALVEFFLDESGEPGTGIAMRPGGRVRRVH